MEDAFNGLAGEAAKLIAQDIEEQMTEEHFFDMANANEWLYTLEGRKI